MRTFANIATLIKTKRTEHPQCYTSLELSNLLGFKCNKLLTSIEAAECSVPLKLMPKLSGILNIHPNEFIEAVMKDHEESLERYFTKSFEKQKIYM